MTKIGDNLWRFDENRRVYKQNVAGNSAGSPIYSEHFIAYEIVGEVGRSWLVRYKDTRHKYEPTKVGKSFVGKEKWFTDQQRDDATYVHEKHYRIVENLRSCMDADVLRAVEKLLQTK